jgi:serine protease
MTRKDFGRQGRRSLLTGIGTALGSLSLAGAAHAQSDEAPGSDSQRALVGMADDAAVSTATTNVKDAATDRRFSIERQNPKVGFMTVEFEGRFAELEDRISEQGGLTYCEADVDHELYAFQPDDDDYPEQYAPQQVRAPQAWETELGEDYVDIAVVDQGTDYEHTDLQSRFGENKGTDEVWFFKDDPSPIFDGTENHGTHVSGIASASTDNGVGIAGISNSRLLSVRALTTIGSGSTASIADGVQYAADQGANIINLSLGAGERTQTMKDAIDYATANGSLPIAAAGNNGEEGVSYPARFEDVVAVGAVDDTENLTEFSQYGRYLDVVAPGKNIRSTVPGDEYSTLSGTSMACPAAAGVAALGLAANPYMGVAELRALLKESSRDIGLNWKEQGKGHVDAKNIVEF